MYLSLAHVSFRIRNLSFSFSILAVLMTALSFGVQRIENRERKRIWMRELSSSRCHRDTFVFLLSIIAIFSDFCYCTVRICFYPEWHQIDPVLCSRSISQFHVFSAHIYILQPLAVNIHLRSNWMAQTVWSEWIHYFLRKIQIFYM